MSTSSDQVEPELVRLSEAPASVAEALYTDLLQPTFPPEELAPPEALRDTRGGRTDGVIARHEGRVVGGLVYDHYVDGAVQLLAYLVVDPSMRAHGLGSRMLREAIAQSDSRLVLAEVEDPRHWPATPTSNPAARLRFWERTGGRVLPLPYAQPTLRPGAERVPHLLLLAVPRAGEELPECVPGPLVGAFVREYYTDAEGPIDPGDEQLAALLRACDVDALRLSTLDHLEVVD